MNERWKARLQRIPLLSTALHMLKHTGIAFDKDHCMLLSASLAFYTALSFAPALILVIWGSSMLGEDTQERVITQVSIIAGEGGGKVARLVLENARNRPAAGSVAGIIAIAGILFSATTVFAQLKQAVNQVWNVKPDPELTILKDQLRRRAASFLLLLFIAILLLAVVVASAVMSHFVSFYTTSSQLNDVWPVINGGVTLVVFIIVVAVVFKFLPDVIIGWQTVWAGAALTGALLLVGKILTDAYFAHSAVGSAYGAGGALFVLLLWVYYSWAIFFFGAEFTQLWARERHHPIEPKSPAVHIEQPSDKR